MPPSKSPLSVYVSQELYDRFAQLCIRLQKNRSAIMRGLVEEACDRLEAEEEAVNREPAG